MDKSLLIKALSETLNLPADEITDEMEFDREVWDSLALLAVSAAVDEHYDVIVPVKELANCGCVKEVFGLIEKRQGVFDEQ